MTPSLLQTLLVLVLAAAVAAGNGGGGALGCVMCAPSDLGDLPHPTRCDALVRCSGGRASVLPCPAGLLFHPHARACLPPSPDMQCVERAGPRQVRECPSGLLPLHLDSPLPLHPQGERDSGSLSTAGACAQNCSAYAALAAPYQHSVCEAENSTCEDRHVGRGVRVSDEWVIVSAHNARRQHLALGLEDQAALNHNLPTAANMDALVWNGELAKVAQALADSCSDYQDCEPCRLITSNNYTVGQNGMWVWTTSADRPDFDAVVQEWYSQVQYVSDEAWLSSYTNPDGVVIGDFTQLVWAQTREVGCGWTASQEGEWVAHYFFCNYGPQGNILGKPVYQFGAPASNCPNGVDSTLPGLCQPDTFIDPCLV